ncbi:MAG: hypothetical protein ABIV47_02860 [Roseiflexaceae bacterium]
MPTHKCYLLGLIIGALLLVGVTAGPRAVAADTGQYTIYLPTTISQTQSIFGLDATSLTPERGLEGLVASGTSWVRASNLFWRDVEPVEGDGYHWDAPSVQLVEQEMLNASTHGLKLILLIRASPTWATAPYRADCAPINPTKYTRFAAFLAAAVDRYSKPPYNVTFWEIGNEPDAPIFPSDSGYGCWGVTNDPFYGGRAYGALLKVVYPAMKAQAAGISVLNGGLLLDNPYNASNGSGRMARFLEGMFIAGAGASFDILSFHSYSFYNDTIDGTRGPTDWKVGYLRELMDRYAVPRKPMLNTEAALLCSISTPACSEAQANAIGRFYIRAIADGLLGHLWYVYDSDAFNNTALVEPSDVSVQRPLYQAYRQVATLLSGARLLGPLEGQVAGIEGYRFASGTRTITIFWSNSEQIAVIPAQLGAEITCADRSGEPIVCANTDGAVQLITRPGPLFVIER